MYLMYVDESGDCGLQNSPTRYFVLTGLVIHELRWRQYLDGLISFRRALKIQFGLRLRDEFHASGFLNKPGYLVSIRRDLRLAMIRAYTNKLATMSDFSVVNIVVDKQGKDANYDVFENAWRALIQRFENTMSRGNFPSHVNRDERGMLFCDHTDDKKLMNLLRRLRHYNPIPNQPTFEVGYRNLPLQLIIEDPSFRDSAHSYFIQSVDLMAFLLYQHLQPSSYMRKKSGTNYFLRLRPILCIHASTADPNGVVRL